MIVGGEEEIVMKVAPVAIGIDPRIMTVSVLTNTTVEYPSVPVSSMR